MRERLTGPSGPFAPGWTHGVGIGHVVVGMHRAAWAALTRIRRRSKRTTVRTLRFRPSSLNTLGWTIHGRVFSCSNTSDANEPGQVSRAAGPHASRGSLPVGTTLTRYGSLTLVLSPVAEITKVPAAVSLVKAYAALQPAGGGGKIPMNGPAHR